MRDRQIGCVAGQANRVCWRSSPSCWRPLEGPEEGWNDGEDRRLSFGARLGFFGPGIAKRERGKVRGVVFVENEKRLKMARYHAGSGSVGWVSADESRLHDDWTPS